jgi:uncharacterized cupredoxin-like copper-binding protein
MLSALGMMALSACSSGSGRPAGTPLEVTVGDFHITPAATVIHGGNVVFLVHDTGPSTHEFVVARTGLAPAALPLRPDGLTIDEDSPLLHIAGEIDELDIGDHGTLQLHLPPGRYVLFCNLEGHYLGGMHALVQVGSDAGRP